MPIGAAIGAAGALGAAGSVGSALISSNAAKDAAAQQATAAQNALSFQQQVYNNNQSILSPYINNGTNAMYSLASLYGLPTPSNPSGGASATNAAFNAFTQLPSYQFPLQQGQLALSDQLNAQGKQQSGAQARETQQFGQGLASTYLMSNYVNPLLSLSGQGQGAASSLAGASNTSGAQIGQSYGNIGAAQASGTIGSANALAGGLQGGLNSLASYTAMGFGGGGSGTYSLSNIGNAPATGFGSPTEGQGNAYAISQGINPWG